MVDADSPVPDHFLCEGDGYYVISMSSLLRPFWIFALCSAPLLVHTAHPSRLAAERRALSYSLRSQIESLSAQGKKDLKKSIRSEIRQYKQNRKDGKEADLGRLLLTLIALILPPLAVYLHQGEINSKFWISFLLTLLIWVPGVVYALLVIFGVIQ